MTATANDPGAASLSGVNTGRMIILAFAISAAIGALGGIAVTPINVRPLTSPGGIYALSGFVAAILGGWGSSSGAVVGGLALGIIQSLATGFLSRRLSGRHRLRVLILVLYFRPSGSARGPLRRRRGLMERSGSRISGRPLLVASGRRSCSRADRRLCWPGRISTRARTGMRIMTTGGLFAMLTIAVVIILGQAGQLSFGHSAFYGIGAYTAAILTVKLPVPHPGRACHRRRWSPG